MVNAQRKDEIVIKLKDISEQIKDLNREALDLVREVKGVNYDLDRRTWHAHIEQSLVNDTQWLGRLYHTLQDAIEEIEIYEELEDVEPDDDDMDDVELNDDDDEELLEDDDDDDESSPSTSAVTESELTTA